MKNKDYTWAGGLVGVVIIALALKDCSSSGSKSPALAGSSRYSPSSAITPTAASTNKASASLKYWHAFGNIMGELNRHIKSPPGQQIAAHRSAASHCRDMPTLYVDTDLVAWMYRVADVFDRKADLIENSSNPLVLIERLARIADGDGAGVAIDYSQDVRQWWAQARQVLREEYPRVRATLTARYGIEFPPQ